MSNINQLPENVPIPKDDGLANHLVGVKLPNIALQDTNGSKFYFSSMAGYKVIYCYPMTGRPDVPLPEGWDIRFLGQEAVHPELFISRLLRRPESVGSRSYWVEYTNYRVSERNG